MFGRFLLWIVRSFVFRSVMAACAVWVAWGIHSAFPGANWLWRTLLAMLVLMVLGWALKPLIWGQKPKRETAQAVRK